MVHVIGKGHLFTRFTIFRAKTACNESGKAIFRKSMHRRRRSSHASSLPSDIPKAPKQHKRVPKHERRVMVESFAKKYREEHGGKFPPLGLTKKEVGGGYYIIRKIVQELEYKSKMPTEGAATDVQTQSDLQVLAQSDVKDDSSDKQVELEEESRGDVLEGQNCQLERESKDSTHACLEMTGDSKRNNVHSHESHVDVPEAQNHALEKNRNNSSHLYPETTEDDNLNNAYLQESCGAVLEERNCVLEDDCKDSSHPCPETIEYKLNSSYLQESRDDVLEARNCVMEKDSKDSSHMFPEKTEDGKLNNFQVEHSDPVAMDSHMHERAVDDRPSESLVHSSSEDQHGYSDIVAAESHHHKKEILSDTFPKDAKDKPKKRAEFVDSVEITNSKNDEPPQLDRDIRENTTTKADDAEILKRSTFWGNLKSFADGIINIWRKR